MDFVDESRGRELDTVIYKPVGATGPLPVIVFAHGWNSDPYIYDTLLDTWAAAGYLVAAPIFPDNSDLVTSDPETDFGAQAQDMSFVLSQILSGVAGPVDPQRVAAAGHSDGGSDIATLALDPNYTDTRFKAYLCLSGDIPDYALDGPFNANPPGTFLAAVGTDDDYGLQPSTTEVFDTVQMTTKVLLTVDGGDHLYMYVDNSSEAEALRAATVRFLNAALAVKAPSNSQLVNAMQPLGDPSIELTDGTCTGAGLTPDGTCQATPDGTPDG
jgi:dienelactone hydrolase